MNAPLNTPQSYCRLALLKEAGWQCIELAEGTVWFTGYLYDNDCNLNREQIGAKFAALPAEPSALHDALAGIDGQFAAVIVRQDATIAVVDHIASYPLLLDVADGKITIADRAQSLGYQGRIAPADLNRDAATVFAMSGFTIGTATRRRLRRRRLQRYSDRQPLCLLCLGGAGRVASRFGWRARSTA